MRSVIDIRWAAAVLAISFLVLAGCSSDSHPSRPATYTPVDPAEAHALLVEETDLVILDVSVDHAAGHIPGAQSLPVEGGRFDTGIAGLDPGRAYLVHAQTEEASMRAAQRLADAGFTRVYRLAGDLPAWEDAGYEVERGSSVVMDLLPAAARRLQDERLDLIVIDVSDQYAAGHLPRAAGYDPNQEPLGANVSQLDPHWRYLVYGRSRDASVAADGLLVEAGFRYVYRLDGDYDAWASAAYAVETGPATFRDLSAPEAWRLLNEHWDFTVIDVSPRFVFEEAHVAGALNFFVGDGSLDVVIPGLNRHHPFLVYSSGDDGADSRIAARAMVEAGLKHVYRLDGDLDDWVNAGCPVTVDPSDCCGGDR